MNLQDLYARLAADARAAGYDNKLVFGEGALRPPIMLIGEAPGAQEEMQGKPFVGKAGQNLNGFLNILGLRREEIYISNVVKLRPSKISPSGNVVNRPPSPQEQSFFRPYLLQEIELVQPVLLVTLGNTALSVFCEKSVGALHGKLLQSKDRYLFPLYHPAAIIYKPALASEYEADLLKLKALLDRRKEHKA